MEPMRFDERYWSRLRDLKVWLEDRGRIFVVVEIWWDLWRKKMKSSQHHCPDNGKYNRDPGNDLTDSDNDSS